MGCTSEIFDNALRQGRKNLLETEAKAICAEYGIPVTKFKLAKNPAEAVEFALEIGYPVVLKVVSPQIIHKSDVGGVMLNLKNERDLRRAYKKIIENVKRHDRTAEIVGVVVQEMAPRSTEVIVGAIKDPQFGHALMFGIGGVFVEILKDVTFRIAPITESDALEMVIEVRAYPLLKGYKGMPTADINAIVKILLNTSRLVMEHQEIKELDLNPIIVYENGAKTVDARIILD
jgi:acetyl-CoA synthetase (ADP-forming)